MLLTHISTCYSKSTNNELGDPIPQNIQSLISNLQNGELPNDLEKLHLGGKKITIKRTEIKIEDNSDTTTRSSSSGEEVQARNNYTNKRGIVLNINENPAAGISTSDNKITPLKFQSLNSTAKNTTNGLIESPQIVQNSEKIPTHPVFPMENLVSFIRVLEENLEQMPEDEQARNREFDLHTDKGKVHLQRISLNENDINTLKQAAAANVAKKQAANQTKQHTSITKPSSLLSNNKVKSFLASPFADIYNRDNLFENRLADGTVTETSIKNADKVVSASKSEPITKHTASEELKNDVMKVKPAEAHAAESVVAEQSGKLAKKIDNIVSTGNTQTTSSKTTTNTNQSEPKKNDEHPQVDIQEVKHRLVNNKQNPKTEVMTPNSLSPEEPKKSAAETKESSLNVEKRSNVLENFNTFNLKTSDMNPPRSLFSVGKSSEFLTQLKSIFNKMGASSALGNGYLESNLVGDYDDDDDVDDGSNLITNNSEEDDDDDDDD